MKKVFLLSLLSITGCASIFEGNTQPVTVRLDPDVPGKCHITERYTPALDFTVPGEVNISRSYYPLDISCTANKGGQKAQARVYSTVSGIGYTGAVATLGVGAVVDTATSDAFDYPNPIIIKLGQISEINHDWTNNNVEYDKPQKGE